MKPFDSVNLLISEYDTIKLRITYLTETTQILSRNQGFYLKIKAIYSLGNFYLAIQKSLFVFKEMFSQLRVSAKPYLS